MYKIQNNDGEYCLLKKEEDWVYVNSSGNFVEEYSAAVKSEQLSEMYAYLEGITE